MYPDACLENNKINPIEKSKYKLNVLMIAIFVTTINRHDCELAFYTGAWSSIPPLTGRTVIVENQVIILREPCVNILFFLLNLLFT